MTQAHGGPVAPIALTINGTAVEYSVDTRVTLLDLLRELHGATGAKKACDRGQCGACTVLLDGRRVNSCLILAVSIQGSDVVTIEGIADADGPHPMQAAFVDADALQCGFCTPGQICSAIGMLREAQAGEPSAVTADLSTAVVELDRHEIRERMSGNLCRCGAYANILAAIETVVSA